MALFKDIEDFSTAYPALKSTNWRMIVKTVELVENQVFRDQVLGHTLFDDLNDAYQNSITDDPTPMDVDLEALHLKCREAIAHLAAHRVLPKLNINFGSGGATVATSTTTERAPLWAVRAHLAQTLADGYGFIDQLIAFLAENETDFPDWAEAPVRIELRESLIPTLREADRHLRLDSAWLLHKLRPAMREVQNGPVLAILGQTALDTLLDHVKNDAVTDAEKLILDQARPAILNSAIADQAVPLSLTANSEGVWQWQSSSSRDGGEQPASGDRMDALIRHHKNKAKACLEGLRILVTPQTPIKGRPADTAGPLMFT